MMKRTLATALTLLILVVFFPVGEATALEPLTLAPLTLRGQSHHHDRAYERRHPGHLAPLRLTPRQRPRISANRYDFNSLSNEYTFEASPYGFDSLNNRYRAADPYRFEGFNNPYAFDSGLEIRENR